jgi:Transposase DNA-binding/Transposase DDE domain
MTSLSIGREFEGASFGDRRLDARLVALGTMLAVSPDRSFPRAAPNQADLRAAYRFMNNDAVGSDGILAPHRAQTAGRAATLAQVLVLHDTTQFEFPGEDDRDGCGFIRSADDQGFLMHCALVVAGDNSRRPLGVIASRTWVRTVRKAKRRRGAETFKDAERESNRWGELVDKAELRLGSTPAIHIADREADAFPLLQKMKGAGSRFVIRMRQDRVVVDEDDERDGHASEAIATAPWIVSLQVPLSRRLSRPMPAAKQPAREERLASLTVSATKIRLKAPDYMPADQREAVEVNVVYAFEENPPEGTEPVSWVLLTTEPVATHEQVLAVLEAYRTRWLIEEFFKALKTGCAIEKRQLESYDALVNALSLFIPIAWQILLLRNLHRTEPRAPAELVLRPSQIEVLRARLPKLMPLAPTVDDALRAVAHLGGHFIKKLPGWQVLGRGMEDLLLLEEGWLLARDSRETSVH